MIEIKRRGQAGQRMPAERAQTPAEGLERLKEGDYTTSKDGASQGKTEAFTGSIGGRDYNAIYRAVYDFHKRHNPPTIDRDYWRAHTPGEDEAPPADLTYWEQAALDMGEVSGRFGGDDFVDSLLCVIHDELVRKYKAAAAAAAGG